MGKRFGNLIKMEPISDNEVEFIYHIPTRALIGLRSKLLTLTKGTAVFSSQIMGFAPEGRALSKMRPGVLIASQTGEALGYGLNAAQSRGITFVDAGTQVYEGMIIGANPKDEDMEINVCKGKQLTNMRSKSSDGILKLTPPLKMSLEQSLDFLEQDELLEITPVSLRLRKKLLTDIDRRRNRRTPN
jgi:GTP-binding protein